MASRWSIHLPLVFAALATGVLAGPALSADRVGSGFRDSVRVHAAGPASPDTGQFRVLRWVAAPAGRCDWFVVFEAGIARVFVPADDWVDHTLFTNSVGLMRNVSARDAIGGSLDMHWLAGEVAMAPTVRWRRFLGRGASLETMIGWNSTSGEGVDGPIGQLRYAPVPEAYIEAGAFPYRYWDFVPYPQAGFATPRLRHETRVFAGLGVAGAPGAVAWTVEALALAVTLAVAIGLSN